jgi:Membrane protein involved in the export of O-antigen and teichoic acid
MKRKEEGLIKKLLDYAIGSGLALIIGFISSPIISRLIDPVDMGKYSMFTLFAGITSTVMAYGTDQSFVRFYYEEDEKNRTKLLRESLKIPLITCITFIVILVICRQYISMYLFDEYNLAAIILIAINSFFMLFNRYALLVIRMKQKGKFYSTLQVINKVLYLIFSLGLCVPLKQTFIVIVSSSVIANVIVTLIALISDRDFWFSKVDKKVKLKNTQKDILKYGFPLIFTFLISWIFQASDKIVIKHFYGFEETGIYTSAFSIIALLNSIQATFLTFWVPVAYERYEKDPEDKSFFKEVFLLVAIIMMLVAIGLIMFKDIIILLLGEKYRAALFMVPCLVFMPVMNTVSETTVLGIAFKKKPKYHLVIAAICAIVNIICNIVLVPSLGAKGAAISNAITYIFFFVIRTSISQKLYYVNYELKKFYIIISFTLILSLYSTFNRTSIITGILAFINVIIMYMCYREIIIKYYKKGRDRLRTILVGQGS